MDDNLLVVYAGSVQRRPPYELALVTELSPEDIAIAGEREGGRERKRGRKGGVKGWRDEGEALTSHASN